MTLPAPGTRIRVHKNLHRGDWSVADPKTGKVLAHVAGVTLVNATCRVQAGGLAAVRRNRVRSVHAYVVGTFAPVVGTFAPTARALGLRAFSYNPFKEGQFVDAVTRTPLGALAVAAFDERGAWYR